MLVSLNDFKILGKGFGNNIVKRKIAETLSIKQYRPTLKTQENSVYLNFLTKACLEAPSVGSSCYMYTSP